jgi:hypothetical protein
MHRIVVSLCIAAIVISSLATVSFGESAVLTKLIPWPLLTAGIPVETVLMSGDSLEQITGWQDFAERSDGVVEFGLLPIGTSADPGISFMLIHGDTPQIVADTDNDEDLANNIVVEHREQISSRSYSWYFTVLGEYEGEQGVVSSETAICVTAIYSYETGGYIVGYSGFAQRRGYLEIDGELISIAITTAQTNGIYEVDQLFVAVDGDRDGYLDSLPGSHETFLPGQGIQIGTVRYDIMYVTPWGDYLEIEPVGTASVREVVSVDELAPGFTATTITGEMISLEAFTDGVVVLLFLPSLVGGDCSSCVLSSPYLNKLTSVHEAVKGLEDVTTIVVTPNNEGAPEDLSALPSTRVHYISDTAITEIYRRNYATIVISPGGMIAAQDDVWALSTRCDGRPRGEFDELNVSELIAVVQRLVADLGDP